MTTSDELIQTSLALEHASRSLARDTLWSPENLTPAVIGTVLGNIASVAEIFPQILEQLSRSLEEALSEQFLQIEGSNSPSDPTRHIDAACDLLAQGREVAVNLNRLVDGAHDQLTHLTSSG
jgi:hypothetical protein